MEQKKERLEDWAENRKAHMKDMPLKDRLKWYVTYYWVQTAAAVLVVSVIVYFIWFYTIGKKEIWMNGAIINVTVDSDAVIQVEETFAETQGVDTRKQVVTLDPYYNLDVTGEEMTQSSIANLAKIEAYYASGDMDLMIAPEKVFDYLLERECSYQNLEEILGEDFVAQFDEEHLLRIKGEDGTLFAGAVSLENTELIEDMGVIEEFSDGDQIWIGIPYSAKHAENAAAFIDYVFR